MKSGVVEAINLTDGSDEVNTIVVSYGGSRGRRLIPCSPLSVNTQHIPLLGEVVYLIEGISDDASSISPVEKWYYVSPIALHRNINHNALEDLYERNESSAGSLTSVSAGIPNSNSSQSPTEFGTGFVELPTLSQLQPYPGDIIFEGRFGQSLRFGHTPNGIGVETKRLSAASKTPSWSSDKDESPITIIRNGVTTNSGYNKFIIEDINKDASSIWLTDQQTINLTLSNKTALGITPVSTYKSPQVIVNSDRVVINSKKDSVIISGKKTVNISTPNWKADMNEMFNQIEAIKNQLTSINIALAAAATGLTATAGSPSAPAITAEVSKITNGIANISSKLTLMKQ
jgi:hypothetical protein